MKCKKGPKRRKTTDRAKLIKELDGLCAMYVKMRDKHTCQRCLWLSRQLGKYGNIIRTPAKRISGRNEHWAHIIPKARRLSLRHDPDNSLVLCRPHHLWWHEHPLDSAWWFKLMFRNRYNSLQKKRKVAQAKRTVRMSELCERQEQLRQLIEKGE